MPMFMCQGRYTQSAVTGMMATPEDRTEPVARLLEQAGGRLVGLYMTFGDYDWVIIAEAPNETAMASALIAATAGGGISGSKTTLLLNLQDSMNSFQQAGELARSFKSAGQPAPQS